MWSSLKFRSIWKEAIKLADKATDCNRCGQCSGKFVTAN